MRESWPLRGMSRDTQTMTGRSASPWRSRISLPAPARSPGWKVVESTPGTSWRIRLAAAGLSAPEILPRV